MKNCFTVFTNSSSIISFYLIQKPNINVEKQEWWLFFAITITMILPNTDSDIAKKSRMEEIHTRLTSLAHVNWHLTTQLLWMDPLLILYSIWFSQCCTFSYSWTFLWNKLSTMVKEVYYSFSNNSIFPVLIELIFHF